MGKGPRDPRAGKETWGLCWGLEGGGLCCSLWSDGQEVRGRGRPASSRAVSAGQSVQGSQRRAVSAGRRSVFSLVISGKPHAPGPPEWEKSQFMALSPPSALPLPLVSTLAGLWGIS